MNNFLSTKFTTKVKGNFMEQEAIKYLEGRGFIVSAQNYRSKRCEIDIIAKRLDLTIFIEVKYRKNNLFGYPEDFLSDGQIERIYNAAEQFMLENNFINKIRFDVVAVMLKNSKIDIQHFEDAF